MSFTHTLREGYRAVLRPLKKNTRAFTLLEVLLVVGAVGILAGIVITAINPAKQLADARDAERESDAKTLLDAIYQYSIDHLGELPFGIDDQLRMIGTASSGCMINCLTGEVAESIAMSDTTQANFALGTYNLTQWSAGANTWIQLTAAGRTARSGTYTSSIKDAGIAAVWYSLSWTPEFPYLKELPSNGASEFGYIQGNANMSENTLLMRMNDAVSGPGRTLTDLSGNGNNGTTAGSLDCTAPGIFNMACAFNGSDGHIQANTLVGDIAGGNFTILTWVNTSSTSTAQAFLSFNTSAGGDKLILGHPAGSDRLQLYDTAWRNTNRIVANGAWHQVGFVFNDTTNQVQVIYDGAIVYTRTFTSSIVATDTFTIGMEYDGANPSDHFLGTMDEIAVWRRTMAAAEALNYWRRGALRLKFQVRSCDDAACSGESFVGPDGTDATYYTELTNTSATLPSVTLTNLPENRYLQYRATFENDNVNYSPYLNEVSAGHIPPQTGGNISFSYASQTDFARGTYTSNTVWNAANSDVRLATLTNHAGEYRSEVKDAGVTGAWNALSWSPTRPYNKELPSNTQIETGYTNGNADMTGNVLLMHMNDGGTAPGRAIADASGLGNAGVTTNAALPFTYSSQIDFGTTIPYPGNTTWNATNSDVRLATLTNHAGTYESIIKDAGAVAVWNALSWSPTRPYNKELPSNGTSESGYLQGNANMSSNVLLMHMNDNVSGPGRTLADSSGTTNNGTTAGSADCTVPGVFSTACAFNGTNAYIEANPVVNDIAGQNITLLAFVKVPAAPSATQTILAINNSSGTNKLSLRITNTGVMQMVGTGTRSTVSIMSTSAQEWHQVGFSISGTTATAYVDGVNRGTTNLSGGAITATDTLTIGASNGAQFFTGTLDEMAIWTRVLSLANEIVPLYNRGTQSLRFQVRSCDDAACSGESFIGPDGTAATYYTELMNTSLTTPALPLTNVPDNRYFQYRVLFDNLTTSNAISPYLKSVRLSSFLPPTTPTVDCTVPGVFSTACAFNGTNAYIEANPVVNDIAGQNITVLGFVKVLAAPSSTRTVLAINNASGTNKLSLRITNTGAAQMVGTGTITSINIVSSAAQQWHQIGFTLNGTSATLYVDGVARGTTNLSGGAITATDTLTIGASNGAQFFTGTLDEMAIWTRVLSLANEIVPLYNRGTQSLRFQVRSCDDAACSGESFIGPDGTAATYYTELMNTSLTTPALPLTNVPDNRYFQYRVLFDNLTTSNAISPYLKSTTTSYALPASGGELTAGTCLDLTPSLVSEYLTDMPVSPSFGSSERTFYAVKRSSTGRITVQACGAENRAEISVTR